ncbi:MAG: D-glycerate dehydrogenase [Elusimicrobia bacterium]|nr:D-glycerate dehydrogenase [Elusimicrobiota bacterium]
MRVLVGWDPKLYPGAGSFRKIGSCTFRRYDASFLRSRLGLYDVLVTHLETFVGDDLLASAPRLKVLATPSTGQDHFDGEAARRRGIAVVSLGDDPAFLEEISSTAEHAWLLIMACARKFRRALERVGEGGVWRNVDLRGRQLRGLTLGVIGYGRLGRMVEGYAHAFGMRVLVHDVAAVRPRHGTAVPLPRLLRESDIVTLHAKWRRGEPPVIGSAALRRMKRGAVLVNTARGGLVDSAAVLSALRRGRLSAAALDVAQEEYREGSLPADPLVRAFPRCPDIIVTPHVGGATLDAHDRVFAKLSSLVAARLKRRSP